MEDLPERAPAAAGTGQPAGHTRHVPELQSIRGLAALFVVMGHCISYYMAPPWWDFVKHLVNTQVCVEIFFVLSGFVLTLSLVNKPATQPALVAFYVKRWFRIYPALIAASILAFGYVWFWHYQMPVAGISQWMMERFKRDRFHLLHIAASFAGALAFLIPPVWTIFIELVASSLLPIPVALMRSDRRRFWILAAVLLAVSAGLGGALYYRIDMYLFDFMLGAALVLIPADRLRPLTRLAPLSLWVALAVVLMAFTRALADVDTWDRWMHLYEIALAAFVIFAFGRAGLTSATLRHPALVWLGDISYSVYLFHFTLMCVTAKLLFMAQPHLWAEIGGIWLGWALFAITVIVTLPLCYLTYRRIEQPGIAFGDRVVRRFVTPSRKSPVPA